MALGAALENVHLQAEALGIKADIELFPVANEPEIIAAVHFAASTIPVNSSAIDTALHIYTRHTNRKLDKRQLVDPGFFKQLREIVSQFKDVGVYYTDNETELNELSEIIAECDKVRLLNELGHEEFYHEMRWSREEAETTRDGVELASVDISQSEVAGFKVAGDWKAVKLLSEWDKGDAFKKLSVKAVKSASAMVLFTIPALSHPQLIIAGRAVQRSWIFANQQGVSVHPMLSPAFFFGRLVHGNGAELPSATAAKLSILRERFLKIFPLNSANNGESEVFLMKVAIAGDMGIRSLRKDKSELFYKA
jgi:hypothetical protein